VEHRAALLVAGTKWRVKPLRIVMLPAAAAVIEVVVAPGQPAGL
jgi:hypothetical protein